MKTEIKVLLYFPKRSAYAPSKEAEFISSPVFDGLYVYENRLLSVDEFNALSENGLIFERDRYSETVKMKLIEVAAESDEPGDGDEGDGDAGDGGETAPKAEAPKAEAPKAPAKKVAVKKAKKVAVKKAAK